MENQIIFKPDEWQFNNICPDNVGQFREILNYKQENVKGYEIGSWMSQWAEIISPLMTLKENTTYKFRFWLKGGINDRFDEVCQLQVILNYDYQNRLVFMLNRNIFKPLKKYNDWKLFEIEFNTGDNQLCELRFVAMKAIMQIVPASFDDDYKDIPNDPDFDEMYNDELPEFFDENAECDCKVCKTAKVLKIFGIVTTVLAGALAAIYFGLKFFGTKDEDEE